MARCDSYGSMVVPEGGCTKCPRCRLSKYHSQKQSLREERSSTGAQHSNSLFKYQVGTSIPVSDQEPRHMDAPQYRLNCQKQIFRLRRLHLLGPDACIFWARMPASTLRKSAQQKAPDAYIFHMREHNQRQACTKKIH